MPDADDELAGGAVVLHVVVGLRHLLQAVVDAVHGEGQLAGRDRVEDLLEGLPGQVGGVVRWLTDHDFSADDLTSLRARLREP